MNAESEIRQIAENWAKAVAERNMDGILAYHSEDIIMFDVPPPFRSIGIEAYRNTWELFFQGTEPGIYEIVDLHIFADAEVAFCLATMKCSWKNSGTYENLDFRLTIGLKKREGKWTICHEHHSVPVTA